MPVDDLRLRDLTEGVLAELAIMAEGLDVEQMSIGRKAGRLQGAQVVAEQNHDTLELLPVDGARAVVTERAPEVLVFVPAQVVDARPGVGVDRADVWGDSVGGPAV